MVLKDFFVIKPIKYLLVALIFCLYQFSSYGQNIKIDSLQHILKTAKADTTEVNALNQLALEFRNNNPDTSIHFAQRALSLSESIKFKKGIAEAYLWLGTALTNIGKYEDALNYLSNALAKTSDKKGISKIYNNIGNIYYIQGNYHEALKNYFSSLDIKKILGDKKGLADSFNNIGNVYYSQGNYSEALKNYFSALKLRVEIGSKEEIAASYNNIGVIYYYQGNYPDALKNHYAALEIREEIGDKLGIGISYNNIGLIYLSQGNYAKELENYLAALKIYEEIDDQQKIATAYNNIGGVYYKQGKYPEAQKNYFTALKIRENIGDKQGIVTSYNNIGMLYTVTGKAAEGKEWLVKSLKLSKEIGNKEGIKDGYREVARADSVLAVHIGKTADWKTATKYAQSALEHYKMYVLYKDSLINEETIKKTEREKNKYEFEQKEDKAEAERQKKEALAEAERRKQRIILWSVIGGGLLVVLFAGFISRSLRITKKQKRIIEIQKDEVTKQKDIAEELHQIAEKQKHIVEEKQKEIVDSITYAKRIQTALLTTNEYIKNNFEAEHFILFKPKDIVSGDFYWALSRFFIPGWDLGISNKELPPVIRPKNLFYIATADCTGHGVPGAFMSMLNISFLNENIVERGILLPHEILNTQRKEIIKALNPEGSTDEAKDGMDCILCVYDFNKMLMHFAAANNPLWLIRDNELSEFKADKMPVGKYDEKMESFTLRTIELQKGDVIYTSTDGFADQFGTNNKKLTKKRFKEELLKIHAQPLLEQKQHLEHFFEKWKGNHEQIDDVCVIGVRIP
jgi:tetratricopeptide (TPR) repeat protein